MKHKKTKVIAVKGGRPLKGTVVLSGAKNSALKVLLAALLTEEEVILKNIPLGMVDVAESIRMLRTLNVTVNKTAGGIKVNAAALKLAQLPLRENFQIRTTLLMLGVLLGRFGQARVPFPKGCKIGQRNFDLHLYALRKLGAKVKVQADSIIASCSSLVGAEIDFPIRTTGGTENAMLAAVLAKGKTVIKNAHTRPEVVDLANFLNKLGAKIKIVGSGLIEIDGVQRLQGATYKIIPDNVEALTYIIAAAVTKGNIQIKDCPLEALEIPLIYLREAGLNFVVKGKTLWVNGSTRLTPLDLSTGPYPGINSDYQPLFAVFASQAAGTSRITDIRFKGRFQYVRELKKMGVHIQTEENSVIIKGPSKLLGKKLKALDLRAGAAFVVAALAASGETEISNCNQIHRGYENIIKKLSALGARIYEKGI